MYINYRLLLSLSESALTTAAGIGGGSAETATNGGRSVMLESASSTFLTTGIESSLAGCCFGLGWLTGLSVVWLTWISELGLTGENTESGTGAWKLANILLNHYQIITKQIISKYFTTNK